MVVMSVTLSGCVSAGTTYWVPPHSTPTLPAELAFLSETPLPAVESLEPAGNLDPISASPTLTPTITLAIKDLPTPEGVTPEVLPEVTETPPAVNDTPFLYYAQAADTLPVVATRFGVDPVEITSPDPIPESEFINPGQLLVIPRRLGNTTASTHLIPDSEVVFSPSTVDFDIQAYANAAGGPLGDYKVFMKSTGMTNGADVIYRVALENSINPRLLLAILEYHSGWVTGTSARSPEVSEDYPLGVIIPKYHGLYGQLVWAVNQISTGYYAYREGRMTAIQFSDGVIARLAPDLNAGTAALQYYFAQRYDSQEWLEALDPDSGFPALYEEMFDNPWTRAQTVEPLFPSGTKQPPLILPFMKNWLWAYTGGPHGAWEQEGAYAALDFAPGSTDTGCDVSFTWAAAAASGLVTRSGNGIVALDLDGDGHEQTGWVLVYLHISQEDQIPVGTWVDVGDPLGHPSCEGGFATGTHIHLTRKYNGEWIPADGPLPFNLGGWIARAGEGPYKGWLTRDGVTVTACTCANFASRIVRGETDP